MKKIALVALSVLLAATAPGLAQNTDKDTTTTSAAVVPAAKENAAVAFLRKAEQKNSETKSLAATFVQTRVDNIFGDEVESSGKFWYQAPGKFRASYQSDNSSEIWMVDNEMVSYVPNIKQVDIVRLEEGKDAPIHQMLLGFGAKVEKIQDVFEVSPAAEQRAGLLGIDFKSKDLSRSLEYGLITIYFDEAKVEPRVIVAQADDSTITVDLKEIRFNPAVEASLFEPKWPKDVDVIRHGAE